MPVSDPLTISTPLSEKRPMVVSSEPFVGGLLDSLPGRPFTAPHRNGLFLVLLTTAIIAFWDPLNELYILTQRQEHYSHIVLIPWLTLYAFYVDRATLLASRQWSPFLGSCLISAGAVLGWQADAAVFRPDVLSAEMLAFVIMCWGTFVLCYGFSAARTFSFGLLFLLCLVPLPAAVLNEVIAFLQRSSADMTDIVFAALGIPFFRDGFIFRLPNLTIHIAEECSGIRSTLSLLVTSLVAGHFFLRSAWGKTALVSVVVPLAIIKNAFRIVGLSLLANYVDLSFITDSALHRFGGIPLFVVSLVILLGVAWLIRRVEKRTGYYVSG